MKTFKTITEETQTPHLKKVFDIIASNENGSTYTSDGVQHNEIAFTLNEVEAIRDELYGQVKDNLIKDGVAFDTLDDIKNRYENTLPNIVRDCRNNADNFKRGVLDWARNGANLVNSNTPQTIEGMAKDGYYNAVTGTGVVGVDPGTFATAYTPVSMSPNEATAYYSSGGLPRIIIDKKTKGALLNGFRFISPRNKMNEKDRLILRDYALSMNFDTALGNAMREGLIYGGALLYPVFKGDSPQSFNTPLSDLIREGTVDAGTLDYFVVADRWNSIMIPDYNLTAKDYLAPDSYFIPIGGVRVNHTRTAVIRPMTLPYWGALRQLGWGVSDFEGWIRSILSYKILISAIPLMAQQMSLLVNEIPLDAGLAMNGPTSTEAFVQFNNQKLMNWSLQNPLTINQYGTLKAIERHYTDFDKLNMALRQDIASNCGIAEQSLFHTQSTGFADNEEDAHLKQSETVLTLINAVKPSIQPLVRMLIYSCFGAGTEQALAADDVYLEFESPQVIDIDAQGQRLEKFSQGVAQLASAGAQLGDAIKIAQKFITDIDIPDDIQQRLNLIESQPANGGTNPPKFGVKEDEETDTKISGNKEEN